MNRRALPPRHAADVRLLLVAVLGALACGRETAGARRPQVTDSAGVRVVWNAPPDPERGPDWTVGGEPEVEIGVVEGAPEYLLYDVSGAVVLSNRVVVVANEGTGELRFYDGRGTYLRSSGGEGDGPGEFRDLAFVDRFAGDSLLTFDGLNLRVSVFDREGRFVRSFTLGEPTNSTFPRVAGVLSTGAVVKRESHPYVAGVATTGTDRAPVRLLVVDRAGVDGDTVGVFLGTEWFVMAVPEDHWMSVRPVRFGPRFVSAVTGDRIAAAATDTFAIRVYSAHGGLREVVRQHRAPTRIGAGDVTRFTDSVLSTVEDERSRRHYREMYELMPTHESFPAFASIRIDRVGDLWVQEYPRRGDPQQVWQVFDREGVFAARVRLPTDLQVLDIGADYVLGVAKDEMGVERVRWYALSRSSG